METNSTIKIRPAVQADLDTLINFMRGIIATERSFDPTLAEGDIRYYDLAQMIDADDVEVMVAEQDGELIGSGYARIADSKPYQKFPQHAFLGFMFVKPEHRGKGVINMILENLKQWSISKGMTELRLQVYDENAPAIKAYEKAGYKPHLLEMRLGL